MMRISLFQPCNWDKLFQLEPTLWGTPSGKNVCSQDARTLALRKIHLCRWCTFIIFKFTLIVAVIRSNNWIFPKPKICYWPNPLIPYQWYLLTPTVAVLWQFYFISHIIYVDVVPFRFLHWHISQLFSECFEVLA